MNRFLALAVLRRREPALQRPFRVPGGLAGSVVVGVGPTLLIAFALWAARDEKVGSLSALLFAALVGLAGAAVYAIHALLKQHVGQPYRPPHP